MSNEELINRLEEEREQIQEDLLCILDEAENRIKDSACQVVVDRINSIIKEIKTNE